MTTPEPPKRKRYKCPEGLELRGYVIRIYPTREQEVVLTAIEDEMRRAWNWLVAQQQQVIDARAAYAVRSGLVPTRPTPPDYSLYPDTDDGHDASHQAREAYRRDIGAWHHAVYTVTQGVECCAWRPPLREIAAMYGLRHDYQLLARVASWRDDAPEVHIGAHLYEALVRNFYTKAAGMRRKKFRRRNDPMPLQTRSGDCLELGAFGARGKNAQFYNCQIKFNGLKIRGRLPGPAPWGRVIGGVSISRQADGWYASVKQEVPPRPPPPAPIPGTLIGIDVGLYELAAMSDGHLVTNPRGPALAREIADRQAAGVAVGRLHQKMARKVRHLLYASVLPYVATYETIAIESLSSDIGQGHGSFTSAMRLTAQFLRARYGDRVREVDPAYTSQICSQCGQLDKKAWERDKDKEPVRTCPACGYVAHRDVNAARNIAARAAKDMAS